MKILNSGHNQDKERGSTVYMQFVYKSAFPVHVLHAQNFEEFYKIHLVKFNSQNGGLVRAKEDIWSLHLKYPLISSSIT